MSKVRVHGILFFAVILTIVSCSNRDGAMEDSPVVASSGNATLHLDEIRAILNSNPGLQLSKIQLQNYVQRWSEKELIYQQALVEQFDKNPAVQKKIYELNKDFIVAAYLQEKIDSNLSVSESEILLYYNENAEEFVRDKDFYNIQLMLLKSATEAYEIRGKIAAGEDFATLAKESSIDASKESSGNMGWITPDRLPEQIARRLAGLSLNTVSTPIYTSLGYYLVLVRDIREKGKVQELEEVRDIIEWRVKARNREDSYKELLSQLNEEAKIDIKWNYLDSLKLER
ncbi:peptidyl-prolyl cis-trans isomerase [candidate division KSB1 bacterium]|nr:peptidyl-prolyl cis-trans isomerase [candidate division KSB1 bacterium]